MKHIKSLLLFLLGQERYLHLVSRVFFAAFSTGLLRTNPTYNAHYMAGRIVRPGNIVIDIGANLGYYTLPFARYVGAEGRVLAVEPVALYRRVLARNVAGAVNVTILPYALGEKEGKAMMGNPTQVRHRHGLTRILTQQESQAVEQTYEVEVRHPMKLFADLPRVDYVKCDVEGFEVPVIPAMRPLLEQHRPIVQVETEGENLQTLLNLFAGLDYTVWHAGKARLIAWGHSMPDSPTDLIAIPREKLAGLDVPTVT